MNFLSRGESVAFRCSSSLFIYASVFSDYFASLLELFSLCSLKHFSMFFANANQQQTHFDKISIFFKKSLSHTSMSPCFYCFSKDYNMHKTCLSLSQQSGPLKNKVSIYRVSQKKCTALQKSEFSRPRGSNQTCFPRMSPLSQKCRCSFKSTL